MDFQHMSYFIEVVRHASISKAAQTLHITQPTLSKIIKNLEDELGVILFNRSTRHIQLTDDGDIFLKFAHLTLSMADDLQVSLNDGKLLKKGKLSLGLPPVIGVSFFPHIIAKFRDLYPGIHLHLIEEGGKIVEQLLRDAKIDLGVVVLPVDESQFDFIPLVERKLSLIVNSNHALANQEIVHLSELRNESFILFKEGFSLNDRVREACIREGFEPIISYESSQWDLISEMVGVGLGIALLPETVSGRIHTESVKVIPKTVPHISWDLAIIWSKHHYLSHAAKGWIQFIREWVWLQRNMI
ncbi:LysR family transcriptional regulator [Paenibacillus sp. LjRoot56]|uniref:LysR family transcriptional regulator n=1 Tax=Paenibacillus sp. LjRoot56 TaxID=3342333 RepID=UPI003ECF93C4